ncbi:MAG: arginine repressor [Lachnospiraceae bacterium]|nr:arginine repressor [Lachnospiraceae bacterium]
MGEGRQGINERREVILGIIAEEAVYTQTELMQLLKTRGFAVTQATVSRDIRELKLVKKPDADGRSVYSVPEVRNPETVTGYGSAFPSFGNAVLSVSSAGNMVVIKTGAGMAQAVCAALDRTKWDGILGTIAGEDTIFAVAMTEEQAKMTAERLKDFWK